MIIQAKTHMIQIVVSRFEKLLVASHYEPNQKDDRSQSLCSNPEHARDDMPKEAVRKLADHDRTNQDRNGVRGFYPAMGAILHNDADLSNALY